MNQEIILKNAEELIKKSLGGESTGHDYWHSILVMRNAEIIANAEGADIFICKLTAILHDFEDTKITGEKEKKKTREFLESQGLDEEIINHVMNIIKSLDFKGPVVKNSMETKEGRVVFDADKLEAIGAIGIARTFAYGGKKNREIYNPEEKPKMNMSTEEYHKDGTGKYGSCTINHFYEKLLLLKDRMLTNKGKELAIHRHKVMEEFLEEFFAEWNGNK